MHRLLKAINKELEKGSRTDADLENLFGKFWPDMEKAVSKLVLSAPKKTIQIADLVSESSIIAGKIFRNTVIQGPAVVAILEGNEFLSCAFENSINVEAMLWTPMNPSAAIGAIGLSRCRFEDCEFRRIGLTGAPEVLKQLQEMYARVSTRETT